MSVRLSTSEESNVKLYRLLTGPDDAVLCERVERMLNLGWTLHGGPTLTFNGASVIAGQAIVKEIEGDYTGFVHLDQLHPRT